VFSVGGAPGVQVPCGGGYAFRPGHGGLPGPPWHVEVRRASGGAVVLTGEVTGLPRWIVQIGDHFVGHGISSDAILGPVETCPPEPA
jgi:hypothetical protein